MVITLPDDRVSASDTDLTINPTADLDLSTNYAIQISADAVGVALHKARAKLGKSLGIEELKQKRPIP